MKKIEGLIAAAFSTLNNDHSVNLDVIPALVGKFVKDGLKGVFVCGTNGEGPNLTLDERMQVAEAYVKAAKGRLLVMVHVGHTTISEARKLAVHAQTIGADAISAVAAFYFKPASTELLVDSLAEIASAAPQLPFYYYHIPAVTGVSVDMINFLHLAEPRIPTLAGIKYTAATLHEYQACLNYKEGKFDILYGYDELLLSALAVGARGAIGSTYNFAAPHYYEVMRLFHAGRLEAAQQKQLQLVEMIRAFLKFSPIPAQKEIMNLCGLNLGPCRLPLGQLSASDQVTLRESLDAIAFR
ncbi:dihydrodipicolinate synthase family protein [Parapedobacter indicus]|uniref:N-acetylneuraminate lyase n=1 Tax=Parapedobacter indicus TaxID=1477437 RepID=A0A1I3IHV6_9SPHI|nr:dihydrodipicolinate synthase family protein [Parapedobacter indicus]PPL02178.1 N-acetylneuraminate lyase [Parapedobacter indicus]SFI47615.1 N-acetylneuraminate lyase [Parapedobacter indicus]